MIIAMTRRLRSLIEVKCTPSASPPQEQQLIALVALQTSRRFDQQPEDDGAVVIGEIDQLRLGDEAAELDQLSCPFAPLHLPFPRAVTVAPQDQPVAMRRRSSCRRHAGA